MKRMAYVGRKSCGCAVAAVVDEPGDRKEVAKKVAEYVEHGYVVERMTVEQARKALTPCQCEKELTATPTQKGER